MGLSKELKEKDPKQHIELMSGLLEKHPNLTLDITWSVLEELYFHPHRKLFVAFINKYSEPFLPGTDFVAPKDDKNFRRTIRN